MAIASLGSREPDTPALERMAGAHGWDPRTYLEVTSPMSARENWQTHHGLVAVARDGEAMSVAIGVRPVHA